MWLPTGGSQVNLKVGPVRVSVAEGFELVQPASEEVFEERGLFAIHKS